MSSFRGQVCMGRYAGRAIVISLVVPMLSTLLVGGVCAWVLVSWYGHDDRATTVAAGRADAVSDYSTNRIGQLDVYWKDANGEGHEVTYRVAASKQPPQSSVFEIRYDPADPDGLAFPADADARLVIGPEPPWWVLFIAAPFLLLTVGIALAWWSRLRAARAAAAGPGTPYRVVPFVVRGATGGFGSTREVSVGIGVLLLPPDAFDPDAFRPGQPLKPLSQGPPARGKARLRLNGFAADRSAARPTGRNRQHVMWNPAFGSLQPGQDVVAHITEGKRPRAVLTTPDGTVWPTGPLRDKDFPRRVRVTVAYRSPVNSRVRPGRAYLLTPLLGLVTAPAAFTTPAALLVVPLAILLGYSFAILMWAWRGGIPAEL